jgi:hypothetical protein
MCNYFGNVVNFFFNNWSSEDAHLITEAFWRVITAFEQKAKGKFVPVLTQIRYVYHDDEDGSGFADPRFVIAALLSLTISFTFRPLFSKVQTSRASIRYEALWDPVLVWVRCWTEYYLPVGTVPTSRPVSTVPTPRPVGTVPTPGRCVQAAEYIPQHLGRWSLPPPTRSVFTVRNHPRPWTQAPPSQTLGTVQIYPGLGRSPQTIMARRLSPQPPPMSESTSPRVYSPHHSAGYSPHPPRCLQTPCGYSPNPTCGCNTHHPGGYRPHPTFWYVPHTTVSTLLTPGE